MQAQKTEILEKDGITASLKTSLLSDALMRSIVPGATARISRHGVVIYIPCPTAARCTILAEESASANPRDGRKSWTKGSGSLSGLPFPGSGKGSRDGNDENTEVYPQKKQETPIYLTTEIALFPRYAKRMINIVLMLFMDRSYRLNAL